MAKLPVSARSVEDASLRAWPALVQESLDGWELRYSAGITKRANSVQPLGPSNRSLSEKVSECEAWYSSRGLPTIFRLTPFADPDLGSRATRAWPVDSLCSIAT
jgi:hypothetical protein